MIPKTARIPLLSLAILLTVLGTFAAAGARTTVPADLPEIGEVHATVAADLDLVGPDGRVQVILELADPPTAKIYAKELARAGSGPAAEATANAAARRHLAVVEGAQARVAGLLAAAEFRATEIYRVQKVYNGIAAFVAVDSLAALGRLPGVKAVHYLIPEYPLTSTSVPFVGAPAVWGNTIGLPAAVQGEGITIGIIDTGVDYQHATFGGTGLLTDYQANDRTVISDGFFPSARVVGGFDFAGDLYNGSTVPAPDPDPMDCNGHGTHVAAIAAGGGVNGDGTPFAGPYGPATPFGSLRIGPGTAPRASIYALRVFGCGGSTALTVSAIEWAADPNDDGDFSDHLDVINLSLGSNFGGRFTASAAAGDNASLVGVIVAAASGNAGDTNFITSSPGSGDRVISVANTLDGGLAGAVLNVTAPGPVVGSYPAVNANFVPLQPAPAGQAGNIVLVDDGSTAGTGGTLTDGCQTPFVNAAAVAGNIALIDRGVCGFIVKAQNAQANGAIGVIVANNVTGDPVPIVMGGTAPPGPAVTIPSVNIARGTRDALVAAGAGLAGNLGAANPGDTVNASSSRGPRRISSPVRLKPDLSAPGTSILAAQSGIVCTGTAPSTGCIVANPSGFIPDNATLTISGTSMATPHVAGFMALLRQLHPDWPVEHLKAVAMGGSIHDPTLGANGSGAKFGLARIGAGRIDMPDSATDNVFAFNADDPGLVSVSFDTEITGVASQQKRVRVVNESSTPKTYTVALTTPTNDAPGVSFSLPGGSSISVPAGGTAELVVQMSANANLMDHPNTDATLSLLQASPGAVAALGNLARHFLTEEGAYLTFSDGAGTDPDFRVPIYVGARPASMMTAPATMVTGGAATGSTTIPLSGTDVCTGTLAPGPSCTGTFPVDVVSLVTPFELHVVSPRATTTAPDWGDIQYAGAAFDPVSGLLLFGVSAWGEWSSPTDVAFNISVDFDENGTYDRIVFNTNPGTLSTVAGNAQAANDTFINTVFNTATSGLSAGGASLFVNRVSAASVESGLFNNNVMFLAATPAQLGLVTGDTTFRYRVDTCPGFNPLCTTKIDSAVGPFFFNYAAQGLNFGGANLVFDLNGAAPPVTWNTANMTTNGALGALLLHHLNGFGKRAEVVVLEGTPSADLAVTKTMAPASPVLGQNVVFTITVSNAGPDTASGIQVADILPAGLTYVSDNGGGAYNTTTEIWTVPGTIAAAGSASLQITATLDTTDPIVNTATISASTPLDTNPGNNQASVTINAPEVADLEVTMSVSSPTVLVGQPVTYSIELLNNGGDVAYSLDVNEQIVEFVRGAGLNPTSSVASHGVYNPATGLWEIASLPTGVTATLDLTFTAPNMAGALTNTVTAAAGTSDNDTANNSASASTTVLSPADVTSTKTVAGTFQEGGAVTYTVTLNNAAAFDQQNNAGAEFTDTLPAALTLTGASASSGVASTAGNTVDWNGVVPAGGSVTITINATINAGTALQTVSNQGSVNVDGDGNGSNEAVRPTDDPAVGGAADPTSFVVSSPSAVAATKTAAGDFVEGGTVTYTIVMSNAGPAAQLDNPGDEFTDVLDAGLTLVSASSSSGTATATLATNTVTWNGAIPAAGSVTITIEAVINPGTGASIIANQGTTSTDSDGNGTNDAAGVTDDPGQGGGADPTEFSVGDINVLEIPTVSEVGLMLLMVLLAGFAVVTLGRRRN
ncbi:MAG: IPTL-CTERM sorting domain-containing protein [Thermoanaerobaculia bacterium]|nr:IPTL-CTERM sorting domain-containing protein [Thermoanaerobaculia bacterium]